MKFNSSNFWLPLWEYLNQPLMTPSYKAVLNPRRFFLIYKVYLLERCLTKTYESEGRQRY